jgi:hypothetical protein
MRRTLRPHHLLILHYPQTTHRICSTDSLVPRSLQEAHLLLDLRWADWGASQVVCSFVSGSPLGSGVRLSEGLLPVEGEVGGVGKGETEGYGWAARMKRSRRKRRCRSVISLRRILQTKVVCLQT